MSDRLGRRLLLASGVLTVLLALIFAAMLVAIGDVRDAGRRARTSQELIAGSNALQTLVLSMETSSRGYVITRQPAFLAPWKRNVAAFPAQARALALLARGNTEEVAAERAVVANIRSYIREFSRPLVAVARRDQGAARAIVATGDGKRRVDVIRSQFDHLIAAETAVSLHQRARAKTSGELATAAGFAGIALGALLILAFALYLARTLVTPARRLQREREQLERRNDINRALLEASVDGIRLVDLEGRTLLANSVIERLTRDVYGLGPDSTLQDELAIADRLSDPGAYLATLHTIADDPECATEDSFELADVRRSFQRHTGPVRDDEGQLIGRIVVIRETTAEREAERLKTELVATVSHELRTPLTGVLGFVELLLHHEVDAATSRRYLSTIHGEARRLTGLVDDFLDVQRIDAGRLTLALESFELGALLEQQVELFSAQSSSHRLECAASAEPLAMVGDRNRIGQVIANLLSNAIKYSPAGGSVTITATPREGFARVCVRDEGLGIPSGQQKEVFTRFFRVDSSDTRAIGGTGLGLALCHEIVTAHGGRIGFASSEGEGSTFWFELPSAWRASAADNRARVLIIEDDAVLATMLGESLALDGLEVESVASGELGFERARALAPAVICLDIHLAGRLDGWQVLAKLKASSQTARVPVIVCTAESGRRTAVALGATAFVAKPFTADQLREAVARQVAAERSSVLVVDDDVALRRLVVETLARDGSELREAAGGAEALAMIAARKPDVLVLDLAMPPPDGFGVLEQLLERAETRRLPVVVLTGRDLTGAERRLLAGRNAAVLEKRTYSGDQLRWLVRHALGEESEPPAVLPRGSAAAHSTEPSRSAGACR